MTVDQLAYSLLAVALVASLLAFIGSRSQHRDPARPLTGYLLANGALGKLSVVSLLVSSSFGLNSLFYAAWLGYTLGIYALVIHASWTASFLALARYAAKIREHRSMHQLLGGSFGSTTRIVTGLCSLIGMTYFIGWEAAIAGNSFSGLVATGAVVPPTGPVLAGGLVAAGTVATCLLYTVVGGLRGNAAADLALNTLKLLCLLLTLGALGVVAYGRPAFSLYSALLPTGQEMHARMTIAAIVANIVFSLAWQFVDASSWQSIIAGRQTKDTDARDNVRMSGYTIFIVPNLLGTIIGILLHGSKDVTADNIIGQAVMAASAAAAPMAWVCALMLIACVMSLLDGMFLACAFTFVVDIFYPKKTLDVLEAAPVRAESILVIVRVVLVMISITGAWGIHKTLQLFGVTLFDFVYIMIIAQLALLGPILITLTGRHRGSKRPMWLPIIVSIAAGVACAWKGTHGWSPAWADGAGIATAATSLVLAFSISSSKAESNVSGVESQGTSS